MPWAAALRTISSARTKFGLSSGRSWARFQEKITRVDSTPERAIFAHSAVWTSAGASWISLSHITPKKSGGTRRSAAPDAAGHAAAIRQTSVARLAAHAARELVLGTAFICAGALAVGGQRRLGRDAQPVEDVHPRVVEHPAAAVRRRPRVPVDTLDPQLLAIPDEQLVGLGQLAGQALVGRLEMLVAGRRDLALAGRRAGLGPPDRDALAAVLVDRLAEALADFQELRGDPRVV